MEAFHTLLLMMTVLLLGLCLLAMKEKALHLVMEKVFGEAIMGMDLTLLLQELEFTLLQLEDTFQILMGRLQPARMLQVLQD